ncbi:MAG: carboxypeptidase-like regulatory domain-containing protein, partial [Acidobacteriaceae bacterium]
MEKFRIVLSSRSAKMFAAISAVSCAAICAALFVIIGSLMPSAAWAQAAASAPPAAGATTASIHGHAQDPLSQPVANTAVEVTTDGKTPLNTFTTDANGDYKGSGIKPGNYTIV